MLLLSLGTGRLSEKNAEVPAAQRIVYQSAKYCMDGTQKIVESEFVAEPLVRSFAPDEVIIVGTSKSAWAGFYCKFGDASDEERVRRLLEIEEYGGKDRKSSELLTLAREVEEIYEAGLNSELFKGIRVRIIMIRYGINEAELKENYVLLGSVGKMLDRNAQYEAAFDITHSFRSLPLYNLVILNYFRNVLQIDLEISHVYYGNLDIRRENRDIAPIVDMGELIEVLDLCNGINEFKDTGNAASLLRYIPDEEKDLKEALSEFDWATQINAFDRIVASLKKLMLAVDSRENSGGNKYADLREMISQVIQVKFFEENGYSRMTAAGFARLPSEEKQFLICKWYFRQNRYGQAVATGMEALRSYLIRIYPGAEEKDEAWLKDEQNRRNAIERLKKVYKNLQLKKGKRNKTEQVLYQLERSRKPAVNIRNVFAHNLGRGTSGNRWTETAGNDQAAKEIIEKFIQNLSVFREYMNRHEKELKAVYQREGAFVKR